MPYLLATSDLIFGLASGMTIKFFPIFFLKQVELAPVATNFVMAATPLAVAAVSAGAAPFASVVGELTAITSAFPSVSLGSLPYVDHPLMYNQIRMWVFTEQ